MNIRQLKIVLKKRGYNDVHFYYTLCLPFFRIQPVLTVGADPYCCLIKESENKWITTMQERGNLLEKRSFSSEYEACAYFENLVAGKEY